MIGANEPVRIQSMLTSDTCDIPSVLLEIESLIVKKCELVRLTVPNKKSVAALSEIRKKMSLQKLNVPLVADIHFNPDLALESCPFMEKIRINPGNYADRKNFKIFEYTEAQYQEELIRIETALIPLIDALKHHQCALRVGVNHGSLSDRIVNRFGNSPVGMVESAIEFLKIFEKHGFHEIILSMKSSNPMIMNQAYRLLVSRMEEENMHYPLHLGVTEAGEGIEGRIKSAIGIGGLLCDGIGDTIRVSLTEPSPQEIPAAQSILDGVQRMHEYVAQSTSLATQPLTPSKNIPPSKEVHLANIPVGGSATLKLLALNSTQKVRFAEGVDAWIDCDETGTPLSFLPIVCCTEKDIENLPIFLKKLSPDSPNLILVNHPHPLPALRTLAHQQQKMGLNFPVGLVLPSLSTESHVMGLAAEAGSLISEKLVNALVCPESEFEESLQFAQNLLQATRIRLFKTDFISCPSCGRTFFDLQSTTAAIKAQLSHLKGLKIGIMGCVVNGPGEMADADFGYVGAGSGKINLYKGQECVERNIPEAEAVNRLISLIKKEGLWKELPE